MPGGPRRDFTVNSMFYNINTREVEDWTRRGLPDLLQHRVIRTPLPARDTFQDGAPGSPVVWLHSLCREAWVFSFCQEAWVSTFCQEAWCSASAKEPGFFLSRSLSVFDFCQ
jgi:hypothetical protein